MDSTLFWQQKWDLWKQAKQFPPLVQGCDYTLSFVLGRDNFGWEYGDDKRIYSGPKLDLSDATIKLVCEKMAVKPSYPDGARGGLWSTNSTVFSVEGEIIDAEAGEVDFVLDTDDTDTVGRVLAQIQVIDANEKKIVPGHIRLTFTERLG